MTEKLDIVLKQVNKKYGEGTVIRGGQYPHLSRFSSGVFALDAEIGGGIPRGRVVIFVGNESTGKSTVAERATASGQHSCRDCNVPFDTDTETGETACPVCGEYKPFRVFWLDVEGTFDPSWARRHGVVVEDLYLAVPDFAEQGVDIVEAVVRTGDIDLVVVDSIAMMTPAVEIEKSSEDAIVGNHAKLMNRFMRAIQSGFNSLGVETTCKPSVILINQLREKVGVMFGSPETMPGGKGQGFTASITVKFTARASEKVVEGGKKKGEGRIIGQEIRFEATKNKTFPPFRTGSFTLYTDDSQELGVGAGTVDNTLSIVDYGVKFGVVSKDGSWFSFTSDSGEELRQQGKDPFIVELESRDDLLQEIARKVMAKVLEPYAG